MISADHFVQTHLCTKLLNKRGSSAGQRRFYGVVSEDNTEENIGLAICGDIGVLGGSKNLNIVVGFVGFVGVKAFERLVSGQAPVRSAIEMGFEGGICREDLKNLLPVEWRDNANRAKRQRAVAPCPSSPPPVINDVEKCKVNTENRKGLTIFHTAGTRTFARYRKVLLYEFLYSGIVPTIAVMLPDLLRLSLEKMRELQEQAISDGRSYNDIDILHQVLGPKLGYVRGLGRAVKPPRSSGSTSTSVARQLREAQLEIDRLKANGKLR
ncbi:hypothetical protein CJ030_MR3G009485 [Morella rubra]|uniref:Uncharacterized protein n=1 Tax=Morella rubra TaxID=262757 RepID=A0A6A1W4K0_9ROSI|nr:hypothetical protein CJ030_MR3G009485 [Morella rubra]